ncbi:hypothetical protein V5O48_017133 [Marasmius crinis-equi]|uniref:CxC2-like cysteine cluster KDZ transposase-associated domain-containing protein n=1 Tax=Marasmius crinis-equi TaxID=585013 RepID=A0ABR3EPU0_9AGAR
MAPAKRKDAHVYSYRVDNRDFESVFARTANVSATTNRTLEAQDRSPMKGRTPWTTAQNWRPYDNDEFALDEDGRMYDWEMSREPFEFEEVDAGLPAALPRTRKKRTKRSRRPGIWWKERYRDKYLDEMIRHDGRGDYRFNECLDCKARKVPVQSGSYRCRQCLPGDLTCKECCIRRHRLNPLHRVQHWSKGSFEDTSLQRLGLIIRLNHVSSQCPNPQKSHQKLQILDVNGIHDVTVEFCDCERKVEPYLQLLRRRIYPATQTVIKTCATFELLEHLHLLSLVAKGGTYDFYKFLEKATCNTGLDVPKSRYRVLQRMLIQWRHLKMLKRGGRGHVPDGISTTSEGELAVACPSCPRPNINLDEGWEKVPLHKRFLYALMVCVDFNFRLKGQLVSSWTRDPGLDDGWSYFVPRQPYEEYIKKHVNEEDASTCVGFAALTQQNSRSSKGLRYTGVGATVCARSEMVLPNGVANLEKGERYSNSDFMLSYAIKVWLPFLLMLVIAYDIACQWMANLGRRMEEDWNKDLRIPAAITTVPVIPKFHHPAHRDEEHDQFNCNLVRGLGNSDCECCERLWSVTNAAAPSTKPMGPGSRLVVLNDHFGHYNWGKYSGMGATLARRYVQAVKDRNQQHEAHRGLTESLPEDLREKWERQCSEWEEKPWNRKGESPFQSKQEWVPKVLSLRNVEKELADYEKDRVKKGAIAYHTTSASAFLILGMEIEESQRRIKKLTKTSGKLSTTVSKTISEQRAVLRKKIRSWALIRPIYMPGLLSIVTELGEDLGDGSNEDQDAESIQIWLPSAIPSGKRGSACVEGLVGMEVKLRTAQCHDALDGIRHTLRLKSRMLLFKHQNVSGQRDGVKSRTVINGVHDRAKQFTESYREHRKALVGLVTEGSVPKELKPLRDADVRSYTDPERARQGPGRRGTREDEVDEEEEVLPADNGEGIDLVSEDRRGGDRRAQDLRREHGTGETRQVNSWIWTTGHINLADGTDTDDKLLLEVWAKSRARVSRAREEVELLREEMRRTLCFLTWKGKWWRNRARGRPGVGGALEEGIRGYAEAQERIQLRLERKFREMWSKPLEEMETEAAAEQEREEARTEDEELDEGDDEGDESEAGEDEDGETSGTEDEEG